jgi:hypothetical protein
VARFVGAIFEPEQEAFFKLAIERLLDMGHRAHLAAGNPPRNGATHNFEQIDACDSRCNQQYPSDKSGERELIGGPHQAHGKAHNLHLSEARYQMGSGFSQVHLY